MNYVVTVEFNLEASDEEAAAELVQYELAGRQENAVESALTDFVVRRVD